MPSPAVYERELPRFKAISAVSCSVVSDSKTAHGPQAPLEYMEFSKYEHWIGLPFTSPGDLSNPEIEPRSLAL